MPRIAKFTHKKDVPFREYTFPKAILNDTISETVYFFSPPVGVNTNVYSLNGKSFLWVNLAILGIVAPVVEDIFIIDYYKINYYIYIFKIFIN